MRFLLPLVGLTLGCTGGVTVDDTDTDTSGIDDTDINDDTGGADDTGDPVTYEDGIGGLSWRLHDIESMVYVSWSQERTEMVHVEYSFDEGEWHSSPEVEFTAGSHEQLLVGIPYESDVEWRVVTGSGTTAEGEQITTGDLPEGLPVATVKVSEPDRWLAEGNYLLSSINEDNGGWTGGHYWTFIIDRDARVVWAHEAPDSHWTLFAQVAVTGDYFMWDEATYWSDWDDGASSTVHKTYLNYEIEQISTPGLHHAFVQLPDSTLAWGSQYHGGGESLVTMGPEDTEETVLWNCAGSWQGVNYCESNGLFYSADRDTFLYSFYTNSSIVEVDHVTGESLWWAGTVNGGYDFDPSNAQFSWQHGITYTDDGNLLVSTESYSGPNTTLVREYEVNHDDGVLSQVWSYDAGTYASYNGDAWRLDNGNTLHMLGSAAEIKEVDADGEAVWHLDFGGSRLVGRGQFIDDLYTLVGAE